MSHFQNNRVIHRNKTSSIQLADDLNSHVITTNEKLENLVTMNTTLNAILVDTDAADSSLNTIEAHSTLQASRLSNVQDWIGTADGLGGGDKSGVMFKSIENTLTAMLVDTDAIDSSTNTIESNSTLQASRLANIQDWVGTADGSGGGAKTGLVINNILTKNTEIDTAIDSMSAKITACNTGAVVLTTGSATIGTINLSATDNAVLDAIASSVSNVDANASDNNDNLVGIDAVLDNILVKNTEIDTVLDNVLTKNTEIDTVLDNILTKNTEIDAVLDTIKTDMAACVTSLALLDDTASVNDVAFFTAETLTTRDYNNTPLDTAGYSHVTIYGTSNGDAGNYLKVVGSNATSGTYYKMKQNITTSEHGSPTQYHLVWSESDPTPRYLKVFNDDSGSHTITMRAVMTNKYHY